MLGNFSYCNPTKLYFGEDALNNLSTELKKYGNNAALVYGGGPIRKNGIYDAVSMPYYRFIMPYGVKKFARFAVNVWDVRAERKADVQAAEEGLAAMEMWMKELGLAMNLSEVGVTPDMIEDIVNGTPIMEGGYKVLSKEEVREILYKAMA